MSFDFSNPKIVEHMLEGHFGLEKESLRVTTEGYLAHTRHPFPDDPNMERDFCENQTELITDVADSADGAWNMLADLQRKAVTTLQHLSSGKELLWPFSNPPYVRGEKDIPIANYRGEMRGKTMYRRYLAEKYGKHKMLFSGIHFNFSFSEELLEEGYRQSGAPSMREYKDSIYLELAKKVTAHSWLVVYLTAASSVLDGSFFYEREQGKTILKDLASPRCSKIGYWNDFIPLLEYDNLQNYVKSIESYVEKRQLKAPAELYYPVRLKPPGENSLERLKELGVNHIELRMIDLNPMDPVGIHKEDVKFFHLLILYLMSLEDTAFLPFEQVMALKNEKMASKYEEQGIMIENGWNSSLPVKYAALHILASMERFFGKFRNPELLKIIRFQEQKIFCPKERYAVQVREAFQEDYVKRGVALAEKYANQFAEESAGQS